MTCENCSLKCIASDCECVCHDKTKPFEEDDIYRDGMETEVVGIEKIRSALDGAEADETKAIEESFKNNGRESNEQERLLLIGFNTGMAMARKIRRKWFKGVME